MLISGGTQSCLVQVLLINSWICPHHESFKYHWKMVQQQLIWKPVYLQCGFSIASGHSSYANYFWISAELSLEAYMSQFGFSVSLSVTFQCSISVVSVYPIQWCFSVSHPTALFFSSWNEKSTDWAIIFFHALCCKIYKILGISISWIFIKNSQTAHRENKNNHKELFICLSSFILFYYGILSIV